MNFEKWSQSFPSKMVRYWFYKIYWLIATNDNLMNISSLNKGSTNQGFHTVSRTTDSRMGGSLAWRFSSDLSRLIAIIFSYELSNYHSCVFCKYTILCLRLKRVMTDFMNFVNIMLIHYLIIWACSSSYGMKAIGNWQQNVLKSVIQ